MAGYNGQKSVFTPPYIVELAYMSNGNYARVSRITLWLALVIIESRHHSGFRSCTFYS